jgi:hypothetical protein
MYRTFAVNYDDFESDLNDEEKLELNTLDLIEKTKKTFQQTSVIDRLENS